MSSAAKHKLRLSMPSDTEIVITRDFDAPRRLVWDAMTNPELIKRWLFAPPGWTMTKCEEDVRVGGKFCWEWAGPDSKTAMTMRGTYREVSAPERAVRSEAFIMAGCGPGSGLEQVSHMVLTETGKRTTVSITVKYPNKEARDGMACSGMEQGMSAGYDNLEDMLARM